MTTYTKYTLLLLLPISIFNGYAEEPDSSFIYTPEKTEETEGDSLEIMADSTSLGTDSINMEADTVFFDETMSALDSIQCTNVTIEPEQPDSVYKKRLQALPFITEVPYNEIVRAYILRYVKKSPKLTAIIKERSKYYFPIFEDILGKYGLPYELEYLAVIESALNPQARSHMGAAGIWQFMPYTGKLYGLEVNSLVDERMDPIKSTESACRFLKALYSTFNDWNLAIAAYNCGPGNINKAIQRSGGKRDFWSIYPYLPHETRNYLPAFVAAAYAMNYADAHGICPDAMGYDISTDTIKTASRLHLQQVASVLDIDLGELRRLNPQYARDILPGSKFYSLCLPSDKALEYIVMEDSILAYRANELINNRRAEIELLHRTNINGAYSVNGVTYYKIKRGDTLGGIAKKFHCTVNQIKAWNGLKNDNIREGKTLKIGR